MADVHCHLLPGIDDGSPDWETTLEMARMAAADGITHIVCTPHANDVYRYDREAHGALLAEAQERIGQSPRLSLGCDFHLSYSNFQDALRRAERYCIGNTHYLLVEFSDFAIAPNTAELLQELRAAGMTPIITHPERNPILSRELETVLQWAEEGALVQVTGSALVGRWGKKAEQTAHTLLEAGAVHVLASDGHNLTGRPPVLSAARDAVARQYGDEVARALVSDNPAAIVVGEPIPFYLSAEPSAE
jgi:protein-tyrosine phosphatase